MGTYHIHLRGIVQGVGFRPLVYKQASQKGLHGYVSNTSDGLHVEINADEKTAKDFLHSLLKHGPPHAKVVSHTFNQVSEKFYSSFIIEESRSGSTDLMMTPDFAICTACTTELFHAHDRRYLYPFITCTHCGPRYSIISALPYDRENTTMQPFTMCPVCVDEYHDPSHRRYYSQTNSCSTCGIHLSVYSKHGVEVENNNAMALPLIISLLKEGNIIAIKSIGGYLLCCDASKNESIRLLRNKKNRPTKPLAIMCADVQQAKTLAEINEEEKKVLMSAAAPIVLLTAKPQAYQSIAMEQIAPGLDAVGIMLAYTPLFQILLHAIKTPLVATSGNISGSPIIYKDDEALREMFNVADFVVTHSREIRTPQDDSVVKIAPRSKQKIYLRHGRGLAPSTVFYSGDSLENVLATGAEMKSNFAFTKQHHVFVSQYLGSTENFEAQQTYTHTVQQLTEALDFIPTVVVADKHPLYFTHAWARAMSEKFTCGLHYIQHHKAHFAAVLAENDLLKSDEPILGIIWDGTGLGDDGAIWGSEFLVYENGDMNRKTHVAYFPVLLDNKMAREPRLSALAIVRDPMPLKKKFTEAEWKLYNAMRAEKNQINCSSLGRCFDAVASILALCDKQTYEGEAALRVETEARKFASQNEIEEFYPLSFNEQDQLDMSALLDLIFRDKNEGVTTGNIAAKFHTTLAHYIFMTAQKLNIRRICFSGGVFQNSFLVDVIIKRCPSRFQLYFHKNIPPNDECVALGQVMYYQANVDQCQQQVYTSKNKIEITVN